MSKGGKSQKATTTNEPWRGAMPYLMGGGAFTNIVDGSPLMRQLYGDTPGLFDAALDQFQGSGYTQDMQNVNQAYRDFIQRQATSGAVPALQNAAYKVAGGAFDFKPEQVSNIAGVDKINPMIITPQNVTGYDARSLQGALNPAGALYDLMQGNVDTRHLDPLAQNIAANITRNVNENILPQIRSGATQAGQYGGSRQGIAEGLAASRAQQDIATGIAPLYQQAFENAQNRKFGVAGDLNRQAVDMATGNVNRDFAAQSQNAANALQADFRNADNQLTTQQFNANLGLNRNAQNAGFKTQNLANRMQGLNMFNQGNQLMSNYYNDYMNALQQPQQYDWQNLMNYSNIIQPGASLGGTSTNRQPVYSNPFGGALGGAATGAAMGSIIPGLGTGTGALIGGGLGLLGGIF